MKVVGKPDKFRPILHFLQQQVAYDSFCIRICTDANATYSAANMCQHTFDLMGCNWVSLPSSRSFFPFPPRLSPFALIFRDASDME